MSHRNSVTVLDEESGHLMKLLKKPSSGKCVIDSNAQKRTNLGEHGAIPSREQKHDVCLEEQLLHAAEAGDASKIKIILHRDVVDIDAQDIMGRTALSLAVANQQSEVVELLLNISSHFTVYEALLISIQHGYDDISEMIINSPKYDDLERHIKLVGRNNFFLGQTAKHSKFTAEVTPIVLASQRKRFEITLMLLQRGERIEKPHKYNCSCNDCKAKRSLDELKFAKWRLNTFKGLASEAYISLSCPDPILRAFQLSWELKELASAEKHYRGEYEALASRLTDYVVKLLDQVRGNDELDVILNEKKGMDDWGTIPDRMARLHLAIKYEQKKFVAHASCQKKLTTVWYGNWTMLDRVPFLLRPVMGLVFMFIYPFLALLYLLLPDWKICRCRYRHYEISEEIRTFVRIPFIKFLSSTMSFVVFVCMVALYVTLTKPQLGDIYDNQEALPVYYNLCVKYESQLPGLYGRMKDFHIRPRHPNFLHLFLLTWILGLLWQECKQLYREGVIYFHSSYNVMDVVLLVFFMASGSLNYITYFKVNEAIAYYQIEENWHSLITMNKTAKEYVYWLNSDREYWLAEDPINIAEGLYAVATIASIYRLSYLSVFSEKLGPLKISMANMTTDVMKFMGIFCFLFMSFLLGLHNLYWYYNPYIRNVVEIDRNPEMGNGESSFGTLELTFRTVYWALFGLGEKGDADLGKQYAAGFTERLGYIIFGVYSWAAVLVLLNMLIAMVTKSFDRVAADQDTEWKFARSELYMEYIREGSTLAVPFNIIPSPKAIVNLVKSCLSYTRREKHDITTPEAQYSQVDPKLLGVHKPYAVDDDDSMAQTPDIVTTGKKFPYKPYNPRKTTSIVLNYQDVMKEVIMRYISNEFQRNKGAEAEMDDLKQEMSNLRFDILNRMNTLQDGVKRNINYISAKVDIISGGIFDDTPTDKKSYRS